ncbi:MAG: hypothetical protein LBV09_03775 [Deferribacteraceae bacterium]|nr:hypothetical protein [Deferribacteraceae bacterium]
MRKILLILLIPCILYAQNTDLAATLAKADDTVAGVMVLPGGDRVAVAVNSGQTGQIIVLSTASCAESSRFSTNGNIAQAFTMGGDPSSLWGTQGDSLKRWSIESGKETSSMPIMDNATITGVSQDEDGEYLAAWSGSRLAIARAKSDNISVVWRGTMPFEITDTAIDVKRGYFFVASKEGTLAKYNTQGVIQNSFDLGKPIYALLIDSPRNALLVAMGDSLLRFDIQSSVFSKITELPSRDMRLAQNGQRLELLGVGRYSSLEYPSLRVIRTQTVGGNKIEILPNGSAISYSGNVLNFYDSVRQSAAGKIYILPNNVGFASHDLQYFGNELFKRAILAGDIPGLPPYVAQDREPNAELACRPMREMLSGVYAPKSPTVNISTPVVAPTTATTTAPTKPQGATTAAPAVTTAVAVATPKPQTAVSVPTTPVTPTPVTPPVTTPAVTAPELPVIASIAVPNLAPGANIPSWVMRPNSLPAYSAVKSGKDVATALNEAKVKIRDDVARNIMKNMLGVELLKAMQNDELKKRFLWMVAAKSALKTEEYVVQKDLWVSPDGIYYVLGQIDTDSVDQIYEPIFQEEMNQLNTYGMPAYMNREPVKW